MARKQSKMEIVAFKVEAELAEILNGLQNKSAFIRKAIASQLGVACPLCQGKGMVERGIHNHFAALIDSNREQPCAGCGSELLLPQDLGELRKQDRARLEQFFVGGPLYCDTCYHKAQACGECGWHIDKKQLREHMKRLHPEEK